ncbi:MAG TPA: fatty acid cis/trans isomerase [Marinagarivorans sp.]
MVKKFKLLVMLLVLTGCATFGATKLNQLFGSSAPVDRVVDQLSPEQIDYWQEVKPILDSRCVVCHACYDAPCQLKMTAIEGIERGASKKSVYNLARPLPAEPSRLFVDASTTQQWREKDFFPVLNEREQTPVANSQAGVMYQMLSLKQQHPLPPSAILSDEFTLGTSRENACPSIEEFEDFADKNPLWGMPYGTPALAPQENRKLMAWLAQGALYTPRASIPEATKKHIAQWEAFLNQPSNKARLMARYLYEHLYLAHLYFSDIDDKTFFTLVRSLTPPGQKVEPIATRRPYDSPGSAQFYYRLVPERETVVVKTHMPYALNQERKDNWQAWFLDADYTVTALPSYKPEEAGNPFLTFRQMPTESRYRFLLDEAQFTIMNFIKGPVCRGQVAVNVIRDHFWVVFVDPSINKAEQYSDFLAENYQDFKMPNTEGDIYLPLSTWHKYADKQLKHLAKRDKLLSEFGPYLAERDLDLIWDGDGENANAGLTIFRHFDSASVQQGLVGGVPKTAWVIDYSLLERIYYLLVAGYDVYGNVGHQLLSRIYMDFLRMEGEATFLYFLPPEVRAREREDWYQGAEEKAQEYLSFPSLEQMKTSVIHYATDNPKEELFRRIKKRLAPAYDGGRGQPVKDVSGDMHAEVAPWKGSAVQYLAEMSILEVKAAAGSNYYSLFKNNGHKNVSTMFKEQENLLPSEHSISLLEGIAGSYPNAFFSLTEAELPVFFAAAKALSSQDDYRELVDRFGVRRTADNFWAFSDRLHRHYRETAPIWAGMLDYNRLENR